MLVLMDKLNEFVNCSDKQEGVINYVHHDLKNDIALEMKGNFSWRIGVAEGEATGSSTRINAKDKTTIDRHLALRDIDLKVKKGELVCVVGETGSGTSTLLQQFIGQLLYIPEREIDFVGGVNQLISKCEMLAMKAALHETPILPSEAPITVRGDLTFVGEDCWLQSTTIRENILFGLEFIRRRYVKVCLACGLENEFL